MSYTINASEINTRNEPYPKGSTCRSVAKKSAKRNGAALYINPANAQGTMYYAKDDGRIRQRAVGTVTIRQGQ